MLRQLKKRQNNCRRHHGTIFGLLSSAPQLAVAPAPGDPFACSSETTANKAFREGKADCFIMDSDEMFWDLFDEVQMLGKGNFTKVKEIEHLETRERFAAKIVGKVNNDMVAMIREVRILSILQHPNIVRLHAAYETPSNVYLIMELADGGELIRIGATRYSEGVAVRHTRTICEAIAYMHGAGVVHRDLKPDNVMLGAPNRSTIKIIDMGLSRPLSSQLMTTVCGTHKYLAPELVECDRGMLRGYG